METILSVGCKRDSSALGPDLSLRALIPTNVTGQDVPCMILVHLTALLSCNEVVTRVIPAIVAEILPSNDVPRFTDEDILRAFSRSPIFQHVLLELGVRPLTREESVNLVQVYWRIFYEMGASLVTLAPGAREFLKAIRRQSNTALAVMAHSTVEAAKVLAELGVDHLVDTVNTFTRTSNLQLALTLIKKMQTDPPGPSRRKLCQCGRGPRSLLELLEPVCGTLVYRLLWRSFLDHQ